MGPEYFCGSGWRLFPVIMPMIMPVFMITVLYHFFGRGGFKPPWGADARRLDQSGAEPETALDIVNKRYARGEISRAEFEQICRDIAS